MTDATLAAAESSVKWLYASAIIFFGVVGLCEFAERQYETAFTCGRAVCSFVGLWLVYRLGVIYIGRWRDRAIAELERRRKGR